MATLDDKLLGEKTHYYCSSDEDERDENEDSENNDEEKQSSSDNVPTENASSHRADPGEYAFNRMRSSQYNRRKWEGMSANTGPKGVIQDFQQYKKFESEQKESNDKEKLELIKKLSLSCRSYLDDQIDKKLANPDDNQDLDDENDPFMKEYIAKRMKEMLEKYQQKEVCKVFGEMQYLSDGDVFLKIIEDKDLKNVLIITHVYNRKIPECKTMNQCLVKLASRYPNVKFCCLDATVAGMSHQFIKNGVPALLVYKHGDLIGNFVSLGDEFGTEFNETDIEDFLVENNILVSSQLISSISYNSNLSKAPK